MSIRAARGAWRIGGHLRAGASAAAAWRLKRGASVRALKLIVVYSDCAVYLFAS